MEIEQQSYDGEVFKLESDANRIGCRPQVFPKFSASKSEIAEKRTS